MNKIEIDLPKGFMNTGVTLDNFLIADTNDSANWKTFKTPLPDGSWSIFKVTGDKVILQEKDHDKQRNKKT